jgi:hypothetical protein
LHEAASPEEDIAMLISRAYAAGSEQPGLETVSPELFFMLLAVLGVPLLVWAGYALVTRLRRPRIA